MNNRNQLFNDIALIICNKPCNLSADECFNTLGEKLSICQLNGKCRLYEKTIEQLNYIIYPTIETNTDCVFLKSCPGSGKTEVVGLKAAYEINRWARYPGGVSILTFTNNAAEVIQERVRQIVGVNRLNSSHYVGTFDSWLYRYIANPFSHLITGYKGKGDDYKIQVIEDSADGFWLKQYKCNTSYYYISDNNLKHYPIYANTIKCSYKDEQLFILIPFSKNNEYISSEEYFEFPAFVEFRKDKSWLTLEKHKESLNNSKYKFWSKGFVTYQDIEYICNKLLIENDKLSGLMAKRFPLIIIDECQDLSETQLEILRCLRKEGAVLHFVGDTDQAIYSFRDGASSNTNNYFQSDELNQLALTENFRSLQPIVDLCSKLIGNEGVKGQIYSESNPVCVCFIYESNQELSLVKAFVNHLTINNIDVHNSAVLARSDATKQRLSPGYSILSLSDVEKLAFAIHLWKSQNEDSRKDSINYIGDFVTKKLFPNEQRNSNYYYCPRSISSNLHWRLILSRLLDSCSNHSVLGNLESTWIVWVRSLNAEFTKLFGIHYQGDDLTPTLCLRSPDGKSHEMVSVRINNVIDYEDPGIRIATIHNVKGETLDAVMLVSGHRGKGGHWKEWLNRDSDGGEYTRFAFVGSSRPKSLLAWAIMSPLDGEDEQKIRDLGFTFIRNGEQRTLFDCE